jgi:23S rRNA (cytidine2498-2'-O)-methyltransferase
MQNDRVGYLAAKGFDTELRDELERHGVHVNAIRGRLLLADGYHPAAWAQNIWLDPVFLPVSSIGNAVKALKAIQRNWHLHPTGNYRRAALIEQQLPPVKHKAMTFGEPAPQSPLGSWTLWESDMLLASAACSSPFPDGEVRFVEDKANPPSRAYLKLWEVFTVTGVKPDKGDLCIDLGASPGGWTWVLASLGAHVFSIDKSPLELSVASMDNVDFCQGSGFGLDPETVGQAGWLFSDMACYPDRLLRTVLRWLEHGAALNYVCTIKLQGKTDHDIVQSLGEIPGSKLMHLSCNKHELTWINLAQWRSRSQSGIDAARPLRSIA